MALMYCGVRGPKTKLMVGYNALEVQNGNEAFEKNFLKNFSKNREEGDSTRMRVVEACGVWGAFV